MNISSFFIERPIFASVLAIIITVAGLLAIPSLPISEYPEIVPPTVVVSGQYPGASPKTIAETVITPLEQQINGVENAIYTNSTATPDGSFSITVTFRLGTNLDIAQVQTQNRVSQAEPRLPDVVRQVGLVTQKRSPDLTMVVFLRSVERPLRFACICATTRSSRSATCSRACRGRATWKSSAPATTPCGFGSIPARSRRAAWMWMRCWQRCASRTCRSRPGRSAGSRRCQGLSSSTSSMPREGCRPSRSSRTSSSRTAPTARRPICATSHGSSSVPKPTPCAACWTANRPWRSRCSSCPARTRSTCRPLCAPA